MKYTLVLVLAIFATASAKAIAPKGFLDDLTAGFMDVYNQVLFPAINTQIQNVALLGAQLLAGLSISGLDGLTSVIGKRDVKGITDFFTDLGNQLVTTLYPTVDQIFQSLALTGAQLLAGIAMNGIGKRENKDFFDSITTAFLDVFNTVLFPAINTQVQNVALLGAQLLAGLSISGIDGLTSVLGKRDVKAWYDDILNNLTATLLPVVDQAFSSLALTGAQLLAGIAMNGIGKRDFFSDLGNQLLTAIMPTLDTAFQSLALTGAQLLAGIAMNGIGKRENKDFFDTLSSAFLDVFNTVLFPAINTQVQNVALLGAQLLAGLSISGIDGLTSVIG